MFEKPFYMFKDLIRILIAYFPPDLYKRMLSISIREHKYPNAFKGTNHFDTSRFALWDFTCDEIGRDSKLTYLDFGVWNGRSIKYFSENFINPSNIFLGLDTFEGLPEEWSTAQIEKGAYDSFGKVPIMSDERVSFYKGMFQDTHEKWLKDILLHDENTLFCHFDADIYSATLFGLTKIGSLKKPFYCIFDQFFGDETRALEDFKASYLFKAELIASGVNSRNKSRQITNRNVLFKIFPLES